ncbi:MAG TPA: tetratricopeptide repeat protein [Candidatus Deferrimicrobium sp.]|nr:tetratricopeptide repeat protein [Candidatus Deferrimicrobium sp.]
MKKEEKVGLFRRLFGKGDEEEANLEPRQPNVVNVSSPNDLTESSDGNKEEVLPWEQTNTERVLEVTSESQQLPDSQVSMDKPPKHYNAERTPTWEELLNKIAPPGTQGGLEPPAVPHQKSDKNFETVTELLMEEPEAESQPAVTIEIPAQVESAVTSDKLPEPDIEETQEMIVAEEIPMSSQIEEHVIRLVPREKAQIENEQVLWLIEQAEVSTSQGEISKAKKFLEIAFNLEPHSDITFALARHEKALGNLKTATDLCLQSLSVFADNREGIEFLLELVEEGASPDVTALSAIESGDVQVNTNLARLFLSLGLQDSALSLFAKAQAQGLNEDDIQFELGSLNDQMGDLTKAKEHYHRYLELNVTSDLHSIACRLFDITLQLGLSAEAKSIAQRYLRGKSIPEIKQRLADFDFQEGMDQFNKQDYDEALNSFYAAMENGEETARSWVIKTLLLIAENTSDDANAIEHLEAALEIGGYNRELAEKIAEKYFAHENYAKAIEYLRQIHEQAPLDTKIIAAYANCLQKIGDYESAAQLFESLSQMGALDFPTREQLFNYYRTKGRYEDAKRHFELLYTPGTEGYNNGLQALAWDQIRLMVEQGDDAKAWVICCEELRNNPSSDMQGLAMKILSERVDSLVAENKVKEALQELEEGRALGLNVLDLGLREASLYETIGNDQAALKVYEETAKKAPEVWEKVKELYLKAATREYLAGNLSESRRLLEDAYAKLPDNLEIRRALGVLYQETGQYALAAALAQNLIEETDIQIPTDHLNVLRPHGYRRIRLG